MVELSRDDVWMTGVGVSGGLEAVTRRRRSAIERRRVVEETFEAGTSVARVALKHGVNANQVFQWRRLYRDGKLGGMPQSAMKLLPVSLVEEAGAVKPMLAIDSPASAGSIHIELPGEVRISFEGRVDPATVRAVLESLRA
jgi:transposase